MQRRKFLALCAAAPFFSAPAFAAEMPAALSFDSHGRPLIEVMLNGQGPFALVLDTGAAATGLSPATIARLSLAEVGRARVHGASGAEDVPLYRLDAIAIGAHQRTQQMGAALPNNPSAEGHAGVLGASMFTGTRIRFDFTANIFTIDDSPARAPLSGAILTPVTFRHRTFAFFPVRVSGVNAQAVLDTGARRSVANAHLRTALGFAADDARLRAVEGVGGATSHRTETFGADVPDIAIAGHEFGGLELAFADLPVFPQLGLGDGPGLILGMDILRRAKSVSLDYDSAQLLLTA